MPVIAVIMGMIIVSTATFSIWYLATDQTNKRAPAYGPVENCGNSRTAADDCFTVYRGVR